MAGFSGKLACKYNRLLSLLATRGIFRGIDFAIRAFNKNSTTITLSTYSNSGLTFLRPQRNRQIHSRLKGGKLIVACQWPPNKGRKKYRSKNYGVHLRTKLIENKRQFEVQRLDYPYRNLVIWIWNRNSASYDNSEFLFLWLDAHERTLSTLLTVLTSLHDSCSSRMNKF